MTQRARRDRGDRRRFRDERTRPHSAFVVVFTSFYSHPGERQSDDAAPHRSACFSQYPGGRLSTNTEPLFPLLIRSSSSRYVVANQPFVCPRRQGADPSALALTVGERRLGGYEGD